MADDGTGLNDDPVSGQARGAGELQTVPEGAEPGGDASDLLPHCTVNEGAGRPHGQDIAAVIVLPLIDLAGNDVVGAAGRGRGAQADLQKQLRIVPAHLLGTDDPHGAGIGRSGEELFEAVLLGGGVVVEEPEPHLVLRRLLRLLYGSHELLLVGRDRRERTGGASDGTGTGQQKITNRGA